MTEKNVGRIQTIVFQIEDNDKFKPVWDSMRSSEPLGAKMLCIAEGDRLRTLERRLKVWENFSECLEDNHRLDALCDELDIVWDEKWDLPTLINKIAEVWQPCEY